MRLLLDTCTFLWLCDEVGRLSPIAKRALGDSDSELLLSSISALELVIKHQQGRLNLPLAPLALVAFARERHRIDSLSVSEAAALGVAKLPLLHRDPFDRLLIAQAIEDGLTLVTPDGLITQYAVRTLW